MRQDTHNDSSVDRPAVEKKLLELQKAIDLGVIEWEEETEERFFASQHANSN